MEKRDSKKNILVAFLLNFLFVIIEVVGGIFTNSVAILSDAIHDFGDSLSLGLAYLLEKKSQQKPNNVYTYGYKRYSILSAFLTSLFLLTGSFVVIYSSILRLINPEPIKSLYMLLIAVFGVIINGLAVLKTAKSNNLNEKSINLHMLEDVIGWIVVLIGSIFILAFNLYILDPILSICVAIYILWHVIENIIEVSKIVLERAPNKFNLELFKNEVNSLDEVDDIHHTHIWTLDGENILLTAHVKLNKNFTLSEQSEIKNKIKVICQKNGIFHSTLEFENQDEICHNETCENDL